MIPQHLAESGERYSPPQLAEFARHVLKTIDLDPASSPAANATIGAEKIYTSDDDGLSLPWEGNLFINPPGSCPVRDAVFSRCGNPARTESGGPGRCTCGLVRRFWMRLCQLLDEGAVRLGFWVGFQVNQLQSLQSQQPMFRLPAPSDFMTLFPSRRIAYVDGETLELMPQPPSASYITLVAGRSDPRAHMAMQRFRAYARDFDLGSVVVGERLR